MNHVYLAILFLILNALKVLCSRLKPSTNQTRGHSLSPRSLEKSEPYFFDIVNYIPLDKARPYPFFYNLASSIQQNTSDLLLYPYAITHPNSTISNGGIFDINQRINPSTVPNWSIREISFSKAKPLYLINIGIISKKVQIEGQELELFFEEGQYCSYFTGYHFIYKKCYRHETEYNEDRSKGVINPYVIYLNEASLVNMLINKDGSNKIDLLFIPDFYPGKLEEAKAYFTPEVVETIGNFLENGGNIVVAGKSSILLETIGLIERNTFNTTLLIRSIKDNDYTVTLKKCTGVDYTPPDPLSALSKETEASFYKNVICNGLSTSGTTPNFYAINKEHINDFETLISYEKYKEELRYVNPNDSKYSPIENEAMETPYLVTKPLKQGRLFIFNSNPLYKFSQDPLFQNLFLYACAKEANLLSKLILTDSNPIPSGENNVELRVDVNFTNYSPNEMTADIHVLLPNYYMMYIDFDQSVCSKTSNSINKDDFDIEKNNLNASNHLLCHYETVAPNQLIYLVFKVGFSSIATNEFATNINIMHTLAYYFNKKTPSNRHFINPPVVKAKTAKAALLKGKVECSGSSFYPLPGMGKDQKTTVKIQNKYTTEARSVTYIDVIPLVTPIIDGNSYSFMGRAMTFMSDYYKQKGFNVPFKETGDSDYLDIAYLNNRNVRLVPEYDQPVQVEKEERTTDKYGPADSIGNIKKVSIGNINYFSLIDNPNTILKQIFINKSSNNPDETQRLMCFVDDTSQTAQKEVLFARIDIHFNSSIGYKPKGINARHVISIDQDHSKEIKWGSFNQEILIPTHFINRLYQNSDAIVLNGTNAKEISKVTNELIPTHYLLPVQSKDIASVDQLKDFISQPDGSGYHKDYLSIKFIKAHSISFSFQTQNPNSQGGKLLIVLPQGITILSNAPIEEGLISFASDKIAFTQTAYNSTSNTIESFFKSGLLSLENSNIVINIERLSFPQSFPVKVEAFEMKYDLSVKDNGHEVYTNVFTYNLQAVYSNFFSLPAIEMRLFTKSMPGNQIKSPFTEYSLYLQELYHRTVYGSMKSTHVTEPGAQLASAGFALITKIGATSQHLINYIAGRSTAIPSSASSSRIEWVDLWNRNWAQPIGTLFVESPSDAKSMFNEKFLIATTFEITQGNGKKRLLKWRPDEEAELRVKIKISNLYRKYFEPTICKAIQLPFKVGDYPSNRVYDDAPIDLEYTGTDDRTQLVLGHRQGYGKCFLSPLAVMSGKTVSKEDYAELSTVKVCNPYEDTTAYEKCTEAMEAKLHVSSLSNNYSPEVEAYYPKGYITQEMWNMTIKEYEDNAVFKGYKYHHDNNLPSIDQEIDVPQNILGFPLLKPIEYSITYDKSLSLTTFPDNKGWWSDNLQNRDNTLLGGQANSYYPSESQQSPLTEDKWIHYSQLNSPSALSKSNNEYMCLFNQHRLKTTAKQSVYAYTNNILQNNIVPIIQSPTNNINCGNIPQYSDKNISQYDNRVTTQSDVDWLYFAGNIRAQSKETINIVLKLKGLTYIEGIFKVLEGIEFNYWNPLSEPNTFTKLKKDPTVIEGIDSGFELKFETWPETCEVAPICACYMLFSITDKGDRFREYELDSYYNSYGFGDVSTGVIVGESNGSKCKVYPGNVTYVDITITNNAGYDFDILKGGIDYAGSALGSALLKNDMKYIQSPTAINIITFTIPLALQKHILIEPSDHLSNYTTQELYLNNYNPTTIKDGTKTHYFFKLTVKDTFPYQEMGMMKEIPVQLNTQHFDHIIGNKDLLPTLHDYLITIPPIKFAVPFNSTSKYAGKVFHVLEYNSGLYLRFDLNGFENFNIATLTNETQVEYFRNITIRNKYDVVAFQKDFEKNIANTRPIRYTCTAFSELDSNGILSIRNPKIVCNFQQISNSFPIKQTNGLPDINKLYVVLAYHTFPLKLGLIQFAKPMQFSYFDYKGLNRTAPLPSAKKIKISGPLIKMKVNHKLVSQKKNGQFFESKDNVLYSTDSGVMKVSLAFENRGDAYAYNLTAKIYFGWLITVNQTAFDPILVLGVSYNKTSNTTILEIITNKTIPVGEGYYLELWLQFEQITGLKRRALAEGNNEPIEGERVIIDRVEIGLVFENVPEKPTASFDIPDRYVIPYPDGGKSKRREIFVNITNVGTFENPKMQIKPETKYFKYDEEDYSFSLFRRIITSEIGETPWEKICENSTTNETFNDTPLTNASIDYVILYRVEAYIVQTGYFAASGVNSHSGNKKIIEEVAKREEGFGLILAISLSAVVLFIIGVVIVGVSYRLYKRRHQEEMNRKDKVVPTKEDFKSIPIETLDHKKSDCTINDSDLSPTKFNRNNQFRQPNFIRIRRRTSTHGTLSIQNFVSEHE